MGKYLSKLNKKTYWIFFAACVFLICIVLFIFNNQEPVKEYQFPLQTEDVESVLTEQNIEWHITDKGVVDESRNIYTLKNDENITMGVDAWVKDNHKIFSMSWFFPSNLTNDQVNDFFSNELSKHLELPGIFYGNKRKLDKALNEVLSYSLNENNYENGVYWDKRVGNDHLRIKISTNNYQNHVISLLIIPDEEYENYLKTSDNFWKEAASSENIEIIESTVAEIKETAKEYAVPVNDMDTFSKHFVVSGRLEDIKENKKVPEPLINVKSNYLKPNKDKYMNARLVDETGSIDVFVEMTSLDNKELSITRNHNVVMLYNNNEFIYVVRPGALYSEE
ncbi:hypothetical protein [Sedimentibacter sp. B4]|uniref:hypothetical protein n=1 Tax=Sedimentibacter sp. B4 TaxID=304766 RepID=UPI00031CB46E|nr:hypothetical protein [Sedimentibacter sp. B4]